MKVVAVCCLPRSVKVISFKLGVGYSIILLIMVISSLKVIKRSKHLSTTTRRTKKLTNKTKTVTTTKKGRGMGVSGIQ